MGNKKNIWANLPEIWLAPQHNAVRALLGDSLDFIDEPTLTFMTLWWGKKMDLHNLHMFTHIWWKGCQSWNVIENFVEKSIFVHGEVLACLRWINFIMYWTSAYHIHCTCTFLHVHVVLFGFHDSQFFPPQIINQLYCQSCLVYIS